MDNYEKALADSMKDRNNMVVRMALASIYNALQEHGDFWAGWIELRIGPLEGTGMFAPEEVAAAKSLKTGIEAMAAAFELMKIPKCDQIKQENETDPARR